MIEGDVGDIENSQGGKKEVRGKRDFWDKLSILSRPLGGILAAFVIALIGYMGSNYLNKQQQQDIQTRLYTELISKREQSESSLRQQMFSSIISMFVGDKRSHVEGLDLDEFDEVILNLELLTYNFHETLDIEPLFKYLRGKIDSAKGDTNTKKDYIKRLEKAAQEISQKQLAALRSAGESKEYFIEFGSEGEIIGPDKFEENWKIKDIKRHFTINVGTVGVAEKKIPIELTVCTLDQLEDIEEEEPPKRVLFHVEYFDFPMIDNVRLSQNERCAIVLTHFNKEQNNAMISLVYFPGSHASLKEKQFYSEIINDLIPEEKGMSASGFVFMAICLFLIIQLALVTIFWIIIRKIVVSKQSPISNS
ncbi:hypothetical protein CEE37_03520 [candidate division LCP-89 bacterium B3_LCP]|uniref:Uncharacterized protein n=1 Tax=candidate division LCP-89 bacterium B3_LCP TaxID=2012998 RepID=A0A532V3C0_UNCL8|nr:MAG: hypothetical protein CEE37_03520 [candidate division LCP-89 bacterium B3_LCP]